MGQGLQAATWLPAAPKRRVSHLQEDPPGLWVMSPEPRGPSEAVLTNKISESHRFQNTGVNAVQGSLLDLAVVMTSHLLSPGRRTGTVHVFLTNRGSPHIRLGHHRTLTNWRHNPDLPHWPIREGRGLMTSPRTTTRDKEHTREGTALPSRRVSSLP